MFGASSNALVVLVHIDMVPFPLPDGVHRNEELLLSGDAAPGRFSPTFGSLQAVVNSAQTSSWKGTGHKMPACASAPWLADSFSSPQPPAAA
jgi:hypothetical protein